MQHSDLEGAARRICAEKGLQFSGPFGEGTFKETFKVVQLNGEPLALKLYKATKFSKRDQREISAMVKCNHPNIAKLVSVESHEYDGQEYWSITEEFLSGGTLTERGRLSVAECLDTGSQLIDALCHISSLGLVHRDIKPDNIMFREGSFAPVLTDFSVVRDLRDSSVTPTWAPRGPGTPFFASPEQLNNEKHLTDWRCDQFTLGVVLSYVTLGLHPYMSPNMAHTDVLDKVASRQRPDDSFVNEAVAVGLQVLVKMVQPWPIDRYRKTQHLQKAWLAQRG